MIIIGLYIIISIVSTILSTISKIDMTQKESLKKRIWRKMLRTLKLINKEIECYSFAIHEKMRIRPSMLGDLFSLIPIKDEQIVVDSIRDLPKKSIVIDAGASIGKYTLLAARNASNVISLEPEKSNFSLLKKNLLLNKFRNVKAINFALARRAGNFPFYISEDSSTHSLYSKKNASQVNSCVVKSITLDKLLDTNNIDQVDLLKMDIEGAELEVLEQSLNSIDRIKIAVIEIHEELYYDKIRKIFEDRGFKTNRKGKFVVAEKVK